MKRIPQYDLTIQRSIQNSSPLTDYSVTILGTQHSFHIPNTYIYTYIYLIPSRIQPTCLHIPKYLHIPNTFTHSTYMKLLTIKLPFIQITSYCCCSTTLCSTNNKYIVYTYINSFIAWQYLLYLFTS